MKAVTWSFGMQSRGGSRIGEAPDFEGCAEAAARAGMTEAIVFAKDHTGFCFYPTKIGVPHPKLKVNLTRGLTDALHRRGIRSIAYFNFGMDGEMGRRHREWLHESLPGKVLLTEDHYAGLCVFGPALTEYLLPLIEEIFRETGVDGAFFDPTGCFGYCCCPECRNAFRKEVGKELPSPENREDPLWKEYTSWLYQRISRCIETVRQHIFAIRPDARVIFNHLGGPAFPHPFPGIPEEPLSCDPPAAFPHLSRYANYSSSFPVPGDIFPERFARGWGDRSDLDDRSLTYRSSIIFMYGQRYCVGDRMHPEGCMAPGSIHALETIVKNWKRMNRFFPDTAVLDPDILCLDNGNHRGFYGAYRMLMDCGRPFMTAPEMTFSGHLKNNRLLVLSGISSLSSETEKVIRNFIREGGIVLAAETLPRKENGSIPDWLGIRSMKEPVWQPCAYLPEWEGKKRDREKVLVRGDIHELALSSARPLQFIFPQYDFSMMGAGFNSSADQSSDVPLLTLNRYGRGKVYFLNAPLFSDYVSGYSRQRDWCRSLLRRIWNRGRTELDSPSGNVEMASYEYGPGKKMHILLNHGGREHDLFNAFESEHLTFPQPVYEVTLKIRSKKDLKVTVNGKKAESFRRGAKVRIPVRMDSIWKIVRTEEV